MNLLAIIDEEIGAHEGALGKLREDEAALLAKLGGNALLRDAIFQALHAMDQEKAQVQGVLTVLTRLRERAQKELATPRAA